MKPFEQDITASILAAKGSGKSVFLAYALDAWPRGVLIDMLGVYNPASNYKTAIVPNSAYFMKLIETRLCNTVSDLEIVSCLSKEHLKL